MNMTVHHPASRRLLLRRKKTPFYTGRYNISRISRSLFSTADGYIW